MSSRATRGTLDLCVELTKLAPDFGRHLGLLHGCIPAVPTAGRVEQLECDRSGFESCILRHLHRPCLLTAGTLVHAPTASLEPFRQIVCIRITDLHSDGTGEPGQSILGQDFHLAVDDPGIGEPDILGLHPERSFSGASPDALLYIWDVDGE